MARIFCAFGIVILLTACVLQLLVSVSLPFLDSLDIVRVHINSGRTTTSQIQRPISELRFGVWGYCVDNASTGARTCDYMGHGYAVAVFGPENSQVANIYASWTKGLAVHPVATVVIFVALLLSFSTHFTVMLVASLTSFLAALITFIAFAIDIALFALTKNEIHSLGGVSSHTEPGPGFWIALTTCLLLLIGGVTVCIGRRRDPTTTKVVPVTPSGKRGSFWRRWGRTTY